MSFASKTSSLQAYNMFVFRNPLHPEFFRIEGRKRIAYGGYDFEAWVLRGGHALRFQFNSTCAAEVVLEQMEPGIEKGLVTTLPCAGERDHEEHLNDEVTYITSMQTETLSDHLYMSTYNEMMDHAREFDCLLTEWTDEAGKPNLSLLDMQRYAGEVHVQGYHLRSDCGLVLRTQTIFQINEEE